MMAVLVVLQHGEYDAASLEVVRIKTLEVLEINVVQ